MQGAWKLVSVEAEAGPAGLPDARPAVVIEGDRMLYGGREIASLTTTPDTSPKLLDLRLHAPERIYEGIFVIEKDSLKVCVHGRADGVKERPESFSINYHPARRLLTFERTKADGAEDGIGFVGLMLTSGAGRREVVVDAAFDGSPAERAGLSQGDVLLKVNGAAMENLKSAVAAVRKAKPGDELALRVRRDGNEREVKVKVARVPFSLVADLEGSAGAIESCTKSLSDRSAELIESSQAAAPRRVVTAKGSARRAEVAGRCFMVPRRRRERSREPCSPSERQPNAGSGALPIVMLQQPTQPLAGMGRACGDLAGRFQRRQYI